MVTLFHQYRFDKREFNELNTHALNALYRSVEVLQYPYKQVNSAIWTSFHSLIPRKTYSDTELETILQFNTGKSGGFMSYQDKVSKTICNAWQLDKNIHEWMNSNFQSLKQEHSASGLLRMLSKLNGNNGEKKVYLHINDDFMEAILFKGPDLIYYNSFPYQSVEDVIYFSLLVYDQLSMDTNKDPLVISGGILADSAIYTTLYKYIRHIRFAPFPSGISLSPAISRKLNNHFYINLISLFE